MRCQDLIFIEIREFETCPDLFFLLISLYFYFEKLNEYNKWRCGNEDKWVVIEEKWKSKKAARKAASDEKRRCRELGDSKNDWGSERQKSR